MFISFVWIRYMKYCYEIVESCINLNKFWFKLHTFIEPLYNVFILKKTLELFIDQDILQYIRNSKNITLMFKYTEYSKTPKRYFIERKKSSHLLHKKLTNVSMIKTLTCINSTSTVSILGTKYRTNFMFKCHVIINY